MVGAALVEEADEFWPSPVGRYPLVTRDDFSEPLDSSFRDFHRAALSTYRAARAAFRSSCSNADDIRSISSLARPCRAAASRHLETALPPCCALCRHPVRNIPPPPLPVRVKPCCHPH